MNKKSGEIAHEYYVYKANGTRVTDEPTKEINMYSVYIYTPNAQSKSRRRKKIEENRTSI